MFARVPDLPGCITTGSSLRDAIEQITDAAANWLIVADKLGINCSQVLQDALVAKFNK